MARFMLCGEQRFGPLDNPCVKSRTAIARRGCDRAVPSQSFSLKPKAVDLNRSSNTRFASKKDVDGRDKHGHDGSWLRRSAAVLLVAACITVAQAATHD